MEFFRQLSNGRCRKLSFGLFHDLLRLLALLTFGTNCLEPSPTWVGLLGNETKSETKNLHPYANNTAVRHFYFLYSDDGRRRLVWYWLTSALQQVVAKHKSRMPIVHTFPPWGDESSYYNTLARCLIENGTKTYSRLWFILAIRLKPKLLLCAHAFLSGDILGYDMIFSYNMRNRKDLLSRPTSMRIDATEKSEWPNGWLVLSST